MVALQVRTPPVRVRTGSSVGAGDHVALVLQSDTVPRRHLAADDLVLIVAPPTAHDPARVYRHALPVEGFMAKYLADNGGFTFTEFLLSTLGTAPAGWGAAVAEGMRWGAQATVGGYAVELALPLEARDRVRLSVTVAGTEAGRRTVHGLARRLYPLNPATFSEIVVRR